MGDSDESTLASLLSASSTLSATYLSHLTSLSLPALLAEPPSLTTQSHHLTSSLTALTHSSYPTFLSLHATTSALSSSLTSLSTSLSSLLTKSLPALEQSAAGFKERTGPVLKERSKAREVLEQGDKLRDLLDVPVLIDTCVRNGYFAEALALASHTRSLSAGYSKSGPPQILRSILAEVDHSILSMLSLLLATLHEPGRKLPALWKAVSFLRKMDTNFLGEEDGPVFSEEELALAFLTGRNECLKRSLEGLAREMGVATDKANGDDLARYLKRYVDVWREGVYDVITQYTAIFLATSTQTPKPASPAVSALLTTLASHLLTSLLLPTLKISLPQLPPSALPALLTQLTYCGSAFARAGLDFRGVLSPLFSSAMLSAINTLLLEAQSTWSTKVASARSRKLPPCQWLVTPTAIDSPPKPSPSTLPTAAHIPPQILASYPPLAEFLNAILNALNALRLLAAISIHEEVKETLEKALAAALDTFVLYREEYSAGFRRRPRHSRNLSEMSIMTSPRQSLSFEGDQEEADNGRDKRVIDAASVALVRVLVPFVRRALDEGVYGETSDDEEEDDDDDDDEEPSELETSLKSWEDWLADREETNEL